MKQKDFIMNTADLKTMDEVDVESNLLVEDRAPKLKGNVLKVTAEEMVLVSNGHKHYYHHTNIRSVRKVIAAK